MKLRVYAERSQYSEPHRKELNDILKALWNNATPEERLARYGRRAEVFETVTSPEAAHVHLLAMKWEHYVERGLVDQARRAVAIARKAGKPIAVFSSGDFEANFPVAGKDIHVFQASAYRSRHATSNHAIPAFFADPLASRGAAVDVRDKRARPIVGFCGQAGSSLVRHAARVVRNRYRRMRWRLGRERWEPPPLEHTWLRQRILNAFAASPEVETRFVLRTRYRAGLDPDNRSDRTERARREFVENVKGSDYTVCIRGGGNFSLRFYEALAMGRMPVFIDTDCVLPYHHQVDWKRHVVWVDGANALDAPAIVARVHARLSPSEFRERQLECRQLWQQRLTADGFYSHFHEHFPELSKPRD